MDTKCHHSQWNDARINLYANKDRIMSSSLDVKFIGSFLCLRILALLEIDFHLKIKINNKY